MILGNPKTLIGALVFYISSLVITLFFAPQLLPIVFLLPLILTAVEFVLVYGLDNLLLPVVAGILFLTFL